MGITCYYCKAIFNAKFGQLKFDFKHVLCLVNCAMCFRTMINIESEPRALHRVEI